MELVNKTGWRPSPPSPKDKMYPMSALAISPPMLMPVRYSLAKYVSRVDDQKSKPWCVAFGTCNAVEFAMRKAGIFVPAGGFSKAYLYARCKQVDGIPDEDGTFVKTALWLALTEGLCPDYLCPTEYWLSQDQLPQINDMMRAEARKYRISGFSRLDDTKGYADTKKVLQAIAGGSFVVVASLVEQENWLDNDDLILYPKGQVLGGHCTYQYGYDLTARHEDYMSFNFGCNSWGTDWGDGGKYEMSHDYMRSRLPDGTPAFLEAWAFSVKPKKPSLLAWLRRWWTK